MHNLIIFNNIENDLVLGVFIFLLCDNFIFICIVLIEIERSKIMELEKEYSCLEKNELVFSKAINVDKNYQETSEAYLDDIFKVVRCTAHSYITSCDIKDSIVYIFGKTEICLTYFNDNNELVYTDFVEDFSESIAVDEVSEYAFAIATVCNKYCNYRIINQRRIDIHISFALNVNVYDKKSCPCVCKCENSKLYTLEEKVSYVENAVVTKVDVEESFNLSANSNGINRVISFEINSTTTDVKTIKDKVFVKSNVSLSVLYTDNDNKIDRAEFNFDVSKIVEASGVDENCNCIVKISKGSLYVKAKSSADDNGGKIELYGDLSLTVFIVKQENKKIVSDGYIVSKKTKNSYASFDCFTDGQYICNSSNSKLSLDLSATVTKVYDLNVAVNDCMVKKQKICIDFEVCILADTSDQGIQYIVQNKIIEINAEGFSLLCTAFVNSFDYTIVNDKNISVNVMYTYSAYVGKSKKINVLTEMDCLDEAVNYPALTLYFAKQNEKLWDIAKQFSSDIELIKKENNITCDSLDSNKVIIIPGL